MFGGSTFTIEYAVERHRERRLFMARKNIETMTPENPVDVVSALMTETSNLVTSVKTEKLAGIESNVYSYTTEVKNKDGQTEIVTRTIRGALAVKTMSLLDKLVYLESQSTKLIVLSMAKLTKKDAESIGKKSVKELILDRFPKYDGNTVDRYRKLGLLFANDRKNADDFTFCDGIPQDTSVTNLDCIIRVLQLKERKDSKGKAISLENLTDSEIESLRDEILHYIIMDRLHPLKPLKALRDEVDEILKEKRGDIIDTTATEKDSESDSDSKKDSESDSESDSDNKKDAIIDKATNACNTLASLFPDNDIIKTAVVQILEQLNEIMNA